VTGLGRRAVLAALQWLGFVDLSAPPPVPAPIAVRPDEPDVHGPTDGHISLGLFVLTRSSSRA
jgi:hypothetical protein